MEDKLQVLLERIREEGVEEARKESQRLIQEAQIQAEKRIAMAEKKAEDILNEARTEAAQHRRNVEAELKLSIQQAVDALKQEITGLITTETVERPLKTAFSEEDFLKKLILKLTEQWSPAEDLALELSTEEQKELTEYFQEQTHQVLTKGLEVKPTPGLTNGFRLGPANGGYVLSFTDEDFNAFLGEFLRPKVKQLLFENGSPIH